MDKTEEGHQPRSRIGLCSCVCGETGGALPEPYRMTSSGLIVHISDQTVRNRLRETGMKDWSPLVGPVLTAHHRAAWLAYAKECKNWQYPPLIPCWLHRWKQVRSDNESKSLETPWETLWCLKHHPALQVFAWVSDDLILILARSYRPAYTDCCLVPGGNPQNFCQTLHCSHVSRGHLRQWYTDWLSYYQARADDFGYNWCRCIILFATNYRLYISK